MSKTTQWFFRAVLFTGTILCLWVVTSANTGSVHAVQQGQYGLTLSWVALAPPKFMCVDDKVELIFVISFAPDPNLAPLAPLVPLGKPTPIPPPAGGSLDIEATNGTLSKSHWTLDFRTGIPLWSSFTYTAKTPGLEALTLTYHYYDSIHTYTGSTPPARIRVQKCDYRVKLKLQRDVTLQTKMGVITSHTTLTGEGGFRIKDERNGNGNTPFFGRGATEVITRWEGQWSFGGQTGQTLTVPGTGTGELTINGEILEKDHSLEMDIMLYPVTMSGESYVATFGEGSSAGPEHLPPLSLDSKYLWTMHFPGEGGTQSFSGPSDIQPPGGTSTDSVEVTVSWED